MQSTASDNKIVDRSAPARPAADQGEQEQARPAIRARAVVLGLILVPCLCWWALRTEIISGGSEMIEASLLVEVVFVLFLLVLINGLALRFRPSWAFTRPELLLIYVMQTTSVGIAGLGQIQFLNQALAGAYHYATPQNHWADFYRFIPQWWVPSQSVLPEYYRGDSSFFTGANMSGWAVPIASWTVFIFLMLGCFLCVSTMLRRHWIEHERLSFPLVALPLQLTQAGTVHSLLGQRQFWFAMAIVLVYRSISGFHRIFPTFPDIPGIAFKGQLVYAGQMFSSPPWDAIGYFCLSFHPIIVGITYFVPLDVSFSMWFFYLVVKAENIIAAAWGYQGGSSAAASAAPYTMQQGAGAFLGLAVVSLWGARRHLRDVWMKAFGLAPRVVDSDEPLSYRTAVFGFILCFGGLVAYVAFGGVSWYLAVGFFALYLLMIVTITRLRAEAGPMLNYGPDLNPHQIMVSIPGSQSWDAKDLTPMAYLNWFDSDYRTVAMPQQMEALKIADTVRLPARRLSVWIMAASLVATVAAFVSVLAIYYHYGAATGRGDNAWRVYNGQQPFDQISDWLTDKQGPNLANLEWMGVGFVVVLLLMRARSLFVWWPFHPAGFCLAQAGWSMPWVWFATFLGWAAKALILRYGGIGLYRKLVPFFLGLILGDVIVACLWSILGVITGTGMYMFFPG